jgi:methyltransferase
MRPAPSYLLFVAAAIVVAIAERVYAAANERRLLRDGGEEVAPWVFRLMAPIYTLLFVAAPLEQALRGGLPKASVVMLMAGLFLAAKALKLWAVLHLRDAWTMRVVLPRTFRVVASGPYRFMRHPNYVAVLGEIVALPLVGGAFITALAGGALFALLLVFRIRSEERALLTRPEYAALMGGKRRFLPGGGG